MSHHLYTNILEAITGRDTTLNKNQPRELTKHSPVLRTVQFILLND